MLSAGRRMTHDAVILVTTESLPKYLRSKSLNVHVYAMIVVCGIYVACGCKT